MNGTINEIIRRAKNKIQHLDTEKILCYTVDVFGDIISGRTVSNESEKGHAFLNLWKLYNMLENERVQYVVLVHNHPRSTMLTSEDDDETTKYVNKLCKGCGVELYDHIIVMKDLEEVYSYKQKNRIIGRHKMEIMPKPKDKPTFVVMKKKTEIQ